MARRLILGLPVLLAVVLALAAQGARAHGTLDQSNTQSPTGALGVSGSFVKGQTFTAGLSGMLDTVALDLQTSIAPTTVTVGVYTTDASGLPASLLTSATVAVTSIGVPADPTQYTAVSFPTPAVITAGKVYAIVLSNVQPAGRSVWWQDNGPPSTYTRGQEVDSVTGLAGPYLGDSAHSTEFQTFVTPPTPTPAPTVAAPPVVVPLQWLPTLTIRTSGCGTTTPAGTVMVNIGQNVVVSVQACAGSRFTGWTGGPCADTTLTTCDIPVGTVTTVTANFAP